MCYNISGYGNIRRVHRDMDFPRCPIRFLWLKNYLNFVYPHFPQETRSLCSARKVPGPQPSFGQNCLFLVSLPSETSYCSIFFIGLDLTFFFSCLFFVIFFRNFFLISFFWCSFSHLFLLWSFSNIFMPV